VIRGEYTLPVGCRLCYLNSSAHLPLRDFLRGVLLLGLESRECDNKKRWFYGFKLHGVCDGSGRLVAIRITPANVADAAYVSAALRKELWERGLRLLTPLRKNMKGLASQAELQAIKARGLIESVFSVLKERRGIVSTLPRSIAGYLAHYIHTLLAYQLGKLAQEALFGSGADQA
jgi:hypothetical protein